MESIDAVVFESVLRSDMFRGVGVVGIVGGSIWNRCKIKAVISARLRPALRRRL